MRTAVASTAIVSSLFPSKVRDRLMEQENDKTPAGKTSLTFKNDPTIDKNAGVGEDAYKKSLPIADIYPEATVLFADLAGFTAWSSSRDPVSVFMLLETVYGAFDK